MNEYAYSQPVLGDRLWRVIVRWGTYPFSWLLVVCVFSAAVMGWLTPRQSWSYCIGLLIVIYVIVERLVPYQKRWGATWSSVFIDIKYMVLNASFSSLLSVTLAYFTISISTELTGPASEWPIALQLLAIFIIFEGLYYSLHRFMHENQGRVGDVLWRVHATHHLPNKLYVLMHVVGHPINTILVALIQILPIWLLGYDPLVVAIFLAVNGMHGIISHFNADVRLGWMSYIFVGPELHRYHHSADMREARNFAATLSIFDYLFGTLVYKPGQAPELLGAAKTDLYPDYSYVLQTLTLPFKRIG